MKKLQGVFTALVTPFIGRSGVSPKIDQSSLRRLVERQISDGVDGFVVNGTTAESPTIERFEIEEIFSTVSTSAKVSGKKLILGAGTNCTRTTIDHCKLAKQLAADAALVVVPYYNKPQQAGLLQHFLSVAEASEVPLILYNVPGRTITKLELNTIVELSQHPNIVGIKEASGDIELAKAIRTNCRSDFSLLSGDDGTYEEFVSVGGDGVISVASHIIPSEMKSARLSKFLGLIDLLFCEPNPVAVKRALVELHLLDSAAVRLPLVEMSPSNQDRLVAEMKRLGLKK